MPKWNGGVIGVANNPTQSSAKGIWSLSEATKAIRAGLWPPSNAGADPYFENVTLLLPGDGTNGAQNNTFLDSSTNNFTITRNGNTTQGTFTPFSKPDGRWSNYFDGSGDYLTVADNSAFDLSNGAFTLEAFVYLTANQSFGLIIGQWGASKGFVLRQANTTFYPSFSYSTDGSAESTIDGTSAIPLNQWNHIAVVRNSSSTLSIFLNGSRVATNASFTATIFNSTANLLVGSEPGSVPTTGYISNARLVKGTAVYDPTQTTLTIPTAPLTAITNTSLLTCQSNRFIDNSTNAFTITRNGDVAVQTFSPFPTLTAYAAGTNGGSGYFDGTGDYLSVANNALIATGDFTMEAWCYTTRNNAYQGIISSGDSSITAGARIVQNNTGNVEFHVNAQSNASTALPINQWNHVAIVRSGSASNNISCYLNGTRLGQLTQTSSTTNNTVVVGRYYNNGTDQYHWLGYIADARFVVGSAVYSGATYTVPTAPLTAVTNTQLLLSGTNGGIIDTSMSNDLETVGNAQISTTQSKFGGASMYFDGTGDYLVSPKTPNLVLGDTWTIECWYRPESRTDTYPTIVSVSPGNQNGTIAIFDRHQSYSSTFSFSVGSGAQVNCSTTVSNGTWYHLALVSNAGSVILYVNGTADNTAASRTTSDNTNRQVYVGCNFDFATYSTEINGYVDDLRITRGIARYTANFTAPTAPFVAFGD